MKKRTTILVLTVTFILLAYLISTGQTNPFERVEKILRQRGSGVYKDGNSLNRDIVKGEYAYCFIITESPVKWDGKKYVPDRESPTCVTMWKEHYDKKKGPGEGKSIIWVQRNAVGFYEALISGEKKLPCPEKEAFRLAEKIINESGL